MNIIPVITLYQPWASWVVLGWKTIETRTHDRFKCLVGKTIGIHAGNHFDDSALNSSYLIQQWGQKSDYVHGALLGTVTVDACGWLSGEGWENKGALIDTVDRFGLFLTDAFAFDTPLTVKGSMGIWYYDLDLWRKVKKPQFI